NSLPSVTQRVLFMEGSALLTDPFDAGIDHELVRSGLEKLLTMDPASKLTGNRLLAWDKATAARLAGPLLYAAENEEIADQMFSSRRRSTLKFLRKLGYQDYYSASASYLPRYFEIPRDIRGKVYYKRGLVRAKDLMVDPGQAKQHLDLLYRWYLDDPMAWAQEGKEPEDQIKLYDFIRTIESAEQPDMLPKLADDATAYFQSELDKLSSDSERVAMCRRFLKATEARDTFRKINALRYLADRQGAGALADVLPYLGHVERRLNQTAINLAANLVSEHGDRALIAAFDKASPHQAQAILAALAQAKSAGSKPLAQKALTHAEPIVRGAAAQALLTIGGQASLPEALDAMAKENNRITLFTYEDALLSFADQPSARDTIREHAIALLPASQSPLRMTLVWLLAQTGGDESMQTLASTLAENQEDEQLSEAIIEALSYSPDPAADQILLGLIRESLENPKNRLLAGRAKLAASEGIRRMVISPEGIGKRPIDEQLDYAEAVLNMRLNEDTIQYLGRIKTGRCAYILQNAMRRGAPASAGEAIVEATSDLSDASKKDREYAEKALVDVIEFIEVTYIRGTAENYVFKTKEDQGRYLYWKAISAKAGQNLLKLTENKEPDPLPEFDDLDLDF
ncbi:MAG: HEAT repeat domain-containing protein, partial [Phycisphaeraceae bacterium]